MIEYFIIVLLTTRLADAVLLLNPPASSASIVENSADGTVVIGSTFSATGQPASALYYYSLTSITPNPGPGNEPFELHQVFPSVDNTAYLKVRDPPGLNFESTAQWTVQVSVQDLNDPSAGTQSGSVTIDITDDPYELPTFLNLPGTGSVRELVTSPEIVKLVSVTDDDNPTDSTGLNFTIVSIVPPGGPFQISDVAYDIPTPGIAVVTIENTANPGLDYESGTTTWDVTIQATNADGDNSTAVLTVNVLDENEPIYISNLPDTQVVGEITNGQIFAVEVVDDDVNATTLPTFTLVTDPVGGPFEVDAFGNIYVVSPGLNFLLRDTWTLTITVEDSGGYTDTKNLFVEVTDQNSGPIVINLPATKTISEDAAGGALVFTLVPYDIDGDFAVCLFAPNPDDGNFEFNSTTYEVSLVDPPSLDHDITSSYEIIVMCNDGMVAGPAAKLTVNIMPVNKPPQILNLPATVTVPEDAINAAAIFSVDGYDIDGDNLDFTISSVTPSSVLPKFSIAGVGTQDAKVSIVNNPNFDYENIDQYIIVVEASDGEYTATGTLNVDIVDVNEPPEFFIKPQTLYIEENTPQNTVLNSIILSVNDPDDPENLTFAMVASPESTFFKVGPQSSPRFKVNNRLDYETDPRLFQVEVSVTDSDGNIAYLPIEVHVINVNDKPPVFTEDIYVGQVSENAAGGTSVLTVLATDAEGDNIVYEIDPYSSYVEVDRITGEVRLKQPLNRETLGRMIQVSVTATDDGSPTPLQDVSLINITITDVNDNEPILAKEFYNWEIRYDASIGTYVDRVTATDNDFGNNGMFEFTLLMDNVYFSIDNIGKISVSDELKAEMEYLLYCRAEDSGNPSQTSDISVIRVDTFIPQLVLINVHLGTTVNDFTDAKKATLLSTLNGLYPPWQFRISAVKSEDVVTLFSRRLLSSNAVLEMYALQDDTTDHIDNVQLHKMFVHVNKLVTSMTVDDAGTPSDVLAGTDIVLVEPTYPVEIVVNDVNWWLDTLEGNITLGVLCFLGFLLLLIPLIICCWKCCCCGRGLSGYCARCCSNICKRRNVDLEDKPIDYEMRKKAPEPVIEKQKMDTSEVPEPVDTGPKKPLPRDDAGVPPPNTGGKFDFRYAGRPHPGGPQTLKVKDQPTLILTPATPATKSADPSKALKTTPVLQRRGGRVSPVVAGSNDNVGNNIDENRFDGSAHNDVTGRTYQFNTQTGERRWNASPHTPRRGLSGSDI